MRTRLELTRFGLRIVGICLLLWCWWQVVGMISAMAGAAIVGNWHAAQVYFQSGFRDATRFITYDQSAMPGPTGQPMMGFNWSLLTWWFRLGLALWLIFWNAWPARLLWRGISNAGHCPKCNYNRRGLAADAKCPECGTVPALPSK